MSQELVLTYLEAVPFPSSCTACRILFPAMDTACLTFSDLVPSASPDLPSPLLSERCSDPSWSDCLLELLSDPFLLTEFDAVPSLPLVLACLWLSCLLSAFADAPESLAGEWSSLSDDLLGGFCGGLFWDGLGVLGGSRPGTTSAEQGR